MIINGKYVDYTLASLLKEKGFDENIETLITPENKVYFLDENSVTNLKHIKISNSNTNPHSDDVSCPDLWDVMKWLREEHELKIVINVAAGDDCMYSLWTFNIWQGNYSLIGTPKFNTYTEACEAAINFCLNKLK